MLRTAPTDTYSSYLELLGHSALPAYLKMPHPVLPSTHLVEFPAYQIYTDIPSLVMTYLP